jgi:hypothetical protein
VPNVGLAFLPAPGDEANRSSDPARRCRCGPRSHEARPCLDRQTPFGTVATAKTLLHSGGRLIVICTATTAGHAADSSRDSQSLGGSARGYLAVGGASQHGPVGQAWS